MYYHYYEFPKWHNVQPHYGVRTERYKLIHYYYNMDEWELFDLKKDPNEMVNLYGTSGTSETDAPFLKALSQRSLQYRLHANNYSAKYLNGLIHTYVIRTKYLSLLE